MIEIRGLRVISLASASNFVGKPQTGIATQSTRPKRCFMQWHTIRHAVLLGYPDCHNQTVAGASLLACPWWAPTPMRRSEMGTFDGFIRDCMQVDVRFCP